MRRAQLHTGRSIVRQAAVAMDENHPDKTPLCAMAKRVSTDAGFEVCNDAVQLFGGYGQCPPARARPAPLAAEADAALCRVQAIWRTTAWSGTCAMCV